MIRSRYFRSIFTAAVVLSLTASAAIAVGPLQFYSVTPCRILDTRLPANAQGTGGPALAAQVVRNYRVRGLCGVPQNGPLAVALNATVVSPTGTGHLTLFPAGGALPQVSNLNFAAGEPALGNGAIVPMHPTDPTFHISSFAGIPLGTSMHLVIDVTGYFAP
jgi:hypothetical protein